MILQLLAVIVKPANTNKQSKIELHKNKYTIFYF